LRDKSQLKLLKKKQLFLKLKLKKRLKKEGETAKKLLPKLNLLKKKPKVVAKQEEVKTRRNCFR
jgi:hypothetical protein